MPAGQQGRVAEVVAVDAERAKHAGVELASFLDHLLPVSRPRRGASQEGRHEVSSSSEELYGQAKPNVRKPPTSAMTA